MGGVVRCPFTGAGGRSNNFIARRETNLNLDLGSFFSVVNLPLLYLTVKKTDLLELLRLEKVFQFNKSISRSIWCIYGGKVLSAPPACSLNGSWRRERGGRFFNVHLRITDFNTLYEALYPLRVIMNLLVYKLVLIREI